MAIHPEVEGPLQRARAYSRERGAEPGVAINPATPPEMIEWVLEDVGYVVVMSVNPGYSGQEFIPASRRKIAVVAEMIEKGGHDVRISLDGGVEASNVAEFAELGVNDFISGGSIFYHRPAGERVRELREAMP